MRSKIDKTNLTGINKMEIGIVKVTSRGQIVIPKNIRMNLGIKEGMKLLAYDKDDEIILKVLRNMEKSPSLNLEKIFMPAWKIAAERGITKKDVEEEIKKYRSRKKEQK